MESKIPLALLEFYANGDDNRIGKWDVNSTDSLSHALGWTRDTAQAHLSTVVMTFEDDSLLTLNIAAFQVMATHCLNPSRYYELQSESEYDEGWDTRKGSDDFVAIVTAYQKARGTVRVIETIMPKEEGNAPTVIDMSVFDTPLDDTPLDLPYNRHVDFEEVRATTRAPDEKDDMVDPVTIMRECFSNLQRLVEHNRHIVDDLADTERELRTLRNRQRREMGPNEGSEWFRAVDEADEHAGVIGFGEDLIGRDAAKWRQQFEADGRTVRTGSPRQRLSGGNHSKEEIAMYIDRRRGHGAPFDVLLPRSGFWLRFKPPRLEDFLTLQYQLSQLKINIGNVTKGLAFSNISQTLRSTVLDFCLQFVSDATCVYRTPTDLKEKIDLGDLDIVMWGLICTVYPRGFPYRHACMADPAKCQHVVKEILNIQNLFWMDESSFTKKQRYFLAKRPWDRPHTDEELAKYREDHVRGRSRIVWFEGGIGLEFKMPNTYEYELSGHAWINGLIEMTNSAYNEPVTGKSRMSYIDTLAMATTGRQYAHMVTAVYEQVDEDSEPVLLGDDRELINAVMSTNFTSSEDFDKLFDAVKELIDDALIGVIAVPSFNCPSCDSPVAKHFHQRYPHLVALDVLSVFFTLHSRKLKN